MVAAWNGQVHPAAECFPAPSEEEVIALAEDLRVRGLLNPGWLLPDGSLLDGRTRRLACERSGVSMRWETYKGDDPVGFVMAANLMRHHYTSGQRAALGAELEPMYAVEAAKRRAQAPGQPRGRKQASVVADCPPQKSRDLAARAVGTSGRSISRYKKLAAEAPDLAMKVRAGELALEKASKRLTRRHSDAEEQAARVIRLTAGPPAHASGVLWQMFNQEFQDCLKALPEGSLDAIVTDPPYPPEFLSVWSDLGLHAARVLKPQGLLIALSGKLELPQVITALGEHLTYGWYYEMPTPGPQSRIMGRHIMQGSRPWLVYSNGTWPSGHIDWHGDITPPSRRAHKKYRWQGDPEPAAYLIERLTQPGAVICDPFCGTGTYGVAAISLGRRFIGIEADSERYACSVERLRAHETGERPHDDGPVAA